MGTLKIKRIYEEASKDDGIRVLVDRLWPRGLKKSEADIDYWFKDIAPSTQLRKWFNHEPDKFKEFSKKYDEELQLNKESVNKLKEMVKHKNVTLLYAAKDPKINHAVVLEKYITLG